MQIRITSAFVQLGCQVQCTRGEVVDLAAEIAQPLVDAGDAIEVPEEERARLHYRPTIAGFVPPVRQKGSPASLLARVSQKATRR